MGCYVFCHFFRIKSCDSFYANESVQVFPFVILCLLVILTEPLRFGTRSKNEASIRYIREFFWRVNQYLSPIYKSLLEYLFIFC